MQSKSRRVSLDERIPEAGAQEEGSEWADFPGEPPERWPAPRVERCTWALVPSAPHQDSYAPVVARRTGTTHQSYRPWEGPTNPLSVVFMGCTFGAYVSIQ